jgi:hypothetical protein
LAKKRIFVDGQRLAVAKTARLVPTTFVFSAASRVKSGADRSLLSCVPAKPRESYALKKAKSTFSASNGQTSRLWRITNALVPGSGLATGASLRKTRSQQTGHPVDA